MFIYCIDEQYANILSKSLKLLNKSSIDDKLCWIFAIQKECKFDFSELDKSKCVISNKMTF